ncbi:MAG: UDP-N-acetylenolpyruvoylglucosamine reductase, partial [Planctomycetes bacterium]|nr:UDP-N-acetylenolpyruvoylglucosamine reductase [Planctomycetota bacterium]
LQEEGIERPTPLDVANAVKTIRRSRLPDPAEHPNAGSFFKNPVVDPEVAARLQNEHPGLTGHSQREGGVKLSAAELIEKCGFKGLRQGGAGIHPRHALVLVNYACEGREVLALAQSIIGAVRERFSVELKAEVRIL